MHLLDMSPVALRFRIEALTQAIDLRFALADERRVRRLNKVCKPVANRPIPV
jgi:hypothetical protein